MEPWSDWVELGRPDEPGHTFARFTSLGGSLAELRLGAYFVRHGLEPEQRSELENKTPLVVPAGDDVAPLHSLMLRAGPSAVDLLDADLSTVHWEHEVLEEAGRAVGVRFVHRDPSGVTFEKTITKEPGQYHLRVVLGVSAENETVARRRAMVTVVASAGMPKESTDNFYQEPQAVAAVRGRDPKQRKPDVKGDPRQGTLVAGEVEYFGTHNKYFAMLMRPADDLTRAVLREANWYALYDPAWVAAGGRPVDGFRDVLVEGVLELTLPEAGQQNLYELVLYAGPKDADRFTPEDEPFQAILREDLGFFDGIASLILGFLRFLHGIVGNWGWAIILLTLVVRALLFPLNRRMQTSMARHATKMKRVQPKIDAIKKKYEKDPQKLRQEQARIFQEEGAMPPLGGCLPIFLQIPIFFGLFSALRVSFDLRQQPFMGWIEDLSQPDRLARIDLNTHLPFIGTIEYFNLLPILMVVLWVGQQKVMPKPAADNEQARQMQKIMMWMPIMFGFFLYNYAAGLSLYMITTSLFGIMEMTVIRRIWPIDDAEQPKKQSKLMARLEELQKRALEQQEMQRRAAQAKGGAGARKRKR
ncbi:MAG: YidC/Oxa1 family insertase periplasmic-domain containing protein [Planctomycetota bacterium]